VILDNGVIRTLDPSLPTCGALAIAGPIVAGGVGTHEWMLPTPERVDLGGRCVLPAFTDSHVHFPTWSLARRDVRLEDADSVASALSLVAAHPRTGQAYWMDVVAIEVHEDGAIPVVDIPAGAPGPRGRASAVGVGGFADLSAHGNGFVRNPRVEV